MLRYLSLLPERTRQRSPDFALGVSEIRGFPNDVIILTLSDRNTPLLSVQRLQLTILSHTHRT